MSADVEFGYTESTCRICLRNCAVANIFSSKGNSKGFTCQEMMAVMFSLPISHNDGLPEKICKKCKSKLISAYKLKNLAVKSYDKLLINSQKSINDLSGITNKEDKVKIEYEIKQELEENIANIFVDDSTVVKDENLEKVLSLEKVENNRILADSSGELHFKTSPKSNYNNDDDDDDDDNTPLVFYAFDEVKEESEDDEIPTTSVNTTAITSSFYGQCEEVTENPGKRDKHANKKTWKKEIRKGKVLREKPVIKKKRGRKKQPKVEEGLSVCHLCGKSVKNLRLHSLCHDENRRKLPCGDCPKVFCTITARKRHRAAHHLGLTYYCQICNKNYKRGYDHIRLRHSERPKIHGCSVCDKRFTDRSQLTYHLSVHTKERAFVCDTCGKAFRTKALCSFHRRRVHDKEKKNICQYCSKGFFSPHHLQIHLRSHTKEKNYKCQECDKCFSTSSGLLVHSKRHAGVKNAICHICSKEFVCKGALNTHMISHTKEKKHPCRFCGVNFGRTDHRNRHEKTAHEKTAA